MTAAFASLKVGESAVWPCEDAGYAQMGPEAPARGERPTADFDSVYDELLPFVWRTARRKGVAPESVEDVCQEVFVVVHRRVQDDEGRSSLKTWVFGVLENVVRTHRRSLARTSPGHRSLGPLVALEDLADRQPRLDEWVALRETELLAQRILNGMDDAKHIVFVLAEIEELGLGEVATAIGIPRSTVVARLRAARADFAAGVKRARARDEWRLG